MSVKRIENIEQFESLREVWNGLVSKTDSDNIFLTFEWLFSWWEIFGEGKKLYILTICEEWDISGIAPFMIDQSDGGKIIKFIGSPNADYSDIIAIEKEEVIAAIFEYLLNNKNDWDLIDFDQINERSSSVGIIKRIIGKYFKEYRFEPTETTMAFTYDGNADEKDKFFIKANKTLRNYMNFFKKNNGLRLDILKERDQIEGFMNQFMHCHIIGWNFKIGQSKFMNPKVREFHRKLTENLYQAGRVALAVLMHGERPLAYLYLFDYHGTVYLYTIANEPFYQRKSLGIILIHKVTEKMIQEGRDIVDFARGAGSHKVKFTNTEMRNFQLKIYSSMFKFRLRNFYESLKRSKVGAKITKNEKLSALKVRLLSSFDEFGFGGTIKLIIKAIFNKIYYHRAVIVFRKRTDNIPVMPNSEKYRVSCLDQSDIETISSFLGFQINSPQYDSIIRRFDSGSECYVVRINGDIAALGWGVFKRDRIPEFDRYFTVKDNEVIISDLVISSLFKGQGIYTFLITYMTVHYLKKNYVVYVLYDKNSRHVIRCKQNLAFDYLCRINYLKIFGIRIKCNGS